MISFPSSSVTLSAPSRSALCFRSRSEKSSDASSTPPATDVRPLSLVDSSSFVSLFVASPDFFSVSLSEPFVCFSVLTEVASVFPDVPLVSPSFDAQAKSESARIAARMIAVIFLVILFSPFVFRRRFRRLGLFFDHIIGEKP